MGRKVVTISTSFRWVLLVVLLTTGTIMSGCGGEAPESTAISASSEVISEEEVSPENMEQNMILKINGEAIPVSWEDNKTVVEIMGDLLAGDITVTMSRYGDFEQVGSLGREYTRNDVQFTTQPGDMVLYNGSNIVLFYGSNTWAYTRLGTMELSEEESRDLLGNEDIELTLTCE